MPASRNTARAATALGAAAVLTLSGAAVAAATTIAPDVNNETRTVSVTFALEEDQSSDVCGAVLTPAASVPRVAAEFAEGEIENILRLLVNDPHVIVLETGGWFSAPVALPNRIPFIGSPVVTVSANDVRPDVYGLVSICLSDRENPAIAPVVMGTPLEAAQGSAETGSAEIGMAVERLVEDFEERWEELMAS